MSGHEQTITVASLFVVVALYLVTIFFFLISDRSRLNYALAALSVIWTAIILGVALPAYSRRREYQLDSGSRSILFALLAVVTVWVMVEVYLTNRGTIKRRLLQVLRGKRDATYPEIERRNGPEDRRANTEGRGRWR